MATRENSFYFYRHKFLLVLITNLFFFLAEDMGRFQAKSIIAQRSAS